MKPFMRKRELIAPSSGRGDDHQLSWMPFSRLDGLISKGLNKQVLQVEPKKSYNKRTSGDSFCPTL